MKKKATAEKTANVPAAVGFLPGRDYVMLGKSKGKQEIALATDCDDGALILGGFHTLCADVGDIDGHPLRGYLAGDPLPMSLWNLQHRADCGKNDSMVYDSAKKIWVDIYLGCDDDGKILNKSFNDFASLAESRKKRLPTDEEFSSFASGSNEMTNIFGSNKPAGSGGHVDQLARRMISNIGCEDCCGIVWQWLSDPWEVDADQRLLAGGYWDLAAFCGSRYRSAYDSRWHAVTAVGARFVSEPRKC